MDNKELGSSIKEMRHLKGLTQGQLGDLIGKSSESIKKYESGYTTLPIDVIHKIADVLGYDLAINFLPKNEQKNKIRD